MKNEFVSKSLPDGIVVRARTQENGDLTIEADSNINAGQIIATCQALLQLPKDIEDQRTILGAVLHRLNESEVIKTANEQYMDLGRPKISGGTEVLRVAMDILGVVHVALNDSVMFTRAAPDILATACRAFIELTLKQHHLDPKSEEHVLGAAAMLCDRILQCFGLTMETALAFMKEADAFEPSKPKVPQC